MRRFLHCPHFLAKVPLTFGSLHDIKGSKKYCSFRKIREKEFKKHFDLLGFNRYFFHL